MIIKALKWWFKGETLKSEVKATAKTLGHTHWADLSQNPNKLGSAAIKIFNNLYTNDVNSTSYWAEAKRKAIKSTLKEVAEKETASKVISLVMSAHPNNAKFTELDPWERKAITSHKETLKQLISTAFSRGSIQFINANLSEIIFDPSKKISKEIVRIFHDYKKLAITSELDEDLFNKYILKIADVHDDSRKDIIESERKTAIQATLTLQSKIAEFNQALRPLSEEIKSNTKRRFENPIEALDKSLVHLDGKKIPKAIHRDAQGGLPTINYRGKSHITPSLAEFFSMSGQKNIDKFSSVNSEANEVTLADVYAKILSPVIALYEEVKQKIAEHHHAKAWKLVTLFASQDAVTMINGSILIPLAQTHELVGARTILDEVITNESKVTSYHLDDENLNISLSYRLFLGENNSIYPLMHFTEIKVNFTFNLTTLEPAVSIEPLSLYPALTTETISEAKKRAPSFRNADQLLDYVKTGRLSENEI